MSTFIPVIWTGISGVRYEFQVDPIGTGYKDRPGVYVFCRLGALGFWDAIYIGETESFERRLWADLVRHHQWDSIRSAGATHIGTLHAPGGLSARLAIEADLRHSNPTPCNQQGRSVA